MKQPHLNRNFIHICLWKIRIIIQWNNVLLLLENKLSFTMWMYFQVSFHWSPLCFNQEYLPLLYKLFRKKGITKAIIKFKTSETKWYFTKKSIQLMNQSHCKRTYFILAWYFVWLHHCFLSLSIWKYLITEISYYCPLLRVYTKSSG